MAQSCSLRLAPGGGGADEHDLPRPAAGVQCHSNPAHLCQSRARRVAGGCPHRCSALGVCARYLPNSGAHADPRPNNGARIRSCSRRRDVLDRCVGVPDPISGPSCLGSADDIRLSIIVRPYGWLRTRGVSWLCATDTRRNCDQSATSSAHVLACRVVIVSAVGARTCRACWRSRNTNVVNGDAVPSLMAVAVWRHSACSS